MIRRPFFGFLKPKLKVLQADEELQAIQDIPLPPRISLTVKNPRIHPENLDLSIGDDVKTGQKIILTARSDDYLISTATGTIAEISEVTSYLGQTFTVISIDTRDDEKDEEFSESMQTSHNNTVRDFFNQLPGAPAFSSLLGFDPPINKIVVTGVDRDLLVTTNQYVFNKEFDEVVNGIDILKDITSIGQIKIIASSDITHKHGNDLDIVYLDPRYPDTLPKMIVTNVFKETVPQGKTPEDIGIGFVTAETVSCLTKAYKEKRIPTDKIVTVIRQNGSILIAKARIGTHVGHILDTLGITVNTGDRVVLGGPMTGHAIHSLDIPISYDTDSIMVQKAEDIVPSSDTYCFNCGECIRICPVKIPVNMLIRLLENGFYEEAADQYDLLCCVECGLCSYVCMAHIPVFHYIMLGKHELAKTHNSSEETNVR